MITSLAVVFFITNSFLLVAFEAYRNTDDALNYVASGGN